MQTNRTVSNGRLDHWSTFHEGLHLALNVEAGRDGSVFVTTGTAVVRLRDTDADGRADEKTDIVTFECSAMMAHSGLVGLGIAADGSLYLGLGKNTGKPYRIIGSDGVELRDGGEGGAIFHCASDGSRLTRIATGLRNPFGVSLDPCGRLFCTENDPDSKPIAQWDLQWTRGLWLAVCLHCLQHVLMGIPLAASKLTPRWRK